MIFEYGSPDFEKLAGSLRKILTENLNDPSLSQDKRNLMGLLYKTLDENNINILKKLDGINLRFNSWSYRDAAFNNNLLSSQNTVLFEIYRMDELTNITLKSIIDSFYLTLYADLYEASLIIEKSDTKEYFEDTINNLQYFASTLSDDIFKRLTYLWFDIPKYVFEIHLRQNLSDKTLENVKKLQKNEEAVNNQIIKSDELAENIKEIQKSLEKQKYAFNFVGLSDGFNNLKEEKKRELCIQNWIHYLLMLTILILIAIKSYWSINYLEDENFDNMVLIVTTVSTILLIFIILYFFRISLVNIKSIKSQILQIDLRLTLCQFIHNYENDTSKLRNENMKSSFDKFESVIFAPLVATEDQMPATFDGLEQLTGLLSSFNKGSK